MQELQASVIIPYFNARRYLPTLIKALQQQDFPQAQFEILLVDNNSTDGSALLLSELLKGSGLQVVLLGYAASQSSYGARNLAVERARGRCLLFTDADCRPAPDWVRSAVTALAGCEEGVVSGAIDLELVDRRNVWEQFDKLAHMRNEKRAARNEIATANLAVSRQNFARVGPFDVARSGGDFAWSRRAAQQGLQVRYRPEVRVAHPTRKSRREIEAKLLRLSYGEGQLFRKRGRSFWVGMGINVIRCLNAPNYLYYSRQMFPDVGAWRVLWFNLTVFFIRARKTTSFARGYLGISPADHVA